MRYVIREAKLPREQEFKREIQRISALGNNPGHQYTDDYRDTAIQFKKDALYAWQQGEISKRLYDIIDAKFRNADKAVALTPTRKTESVEWDLDEMIRAYDELSKAIDYLYSLLKSGERMKKNDIYLSQAEYDDLRKVLASNPEWQEDFTDNNRHFKAMERKLKELWDSIGK